MKSFIPKFIREDLDEISSISIDSNPFVSDKNKKRLKEILDIKEKSENYKNQKK